MMLALVIKKINNKFIIIVLFKGSGEHEVSLVFTTCKDNQFTCDDGICINMQSRCDRKEDCAVSILIDKLNIESHTSSNKYSNFLQYNFCS